MVRHVLNTTGNCFKMLGFTILYLISSEFIDSLSPKQSKGSVFETVLIGVSVSIFLIAFMVWRYHHQLARTNPHGFHRQPLTKKTVGAFIGFAVLMMVIQSSWSAVISFQWVAYPTNQKIIDQAANQFPVINYLSSGLIAPVFEELIFRGFFFNYFFVNVKRKGQQIAGVFVCGLLFGFMHTLAFDVNLFFYSALGWTLAAAYLYFKDLRYSIGLHMFNNLI